MGAKTKTSKRVAEVCRRLPQVTLPKRLCEAEERQETNKRWGLLYKKRATFKCCVCGVPDTYNVFPLDPPLEYDEYLLGLFLYGDHYIPVHRACLELFLLTPNLYEPDMDSE